MAADNIPSKVSCGGRQNFAHYVILGITSLTKAARGWNLSLMVKILEVIVSAGQLLGAVYCAHLFTSTC